MKRKLNHWSNYWKAGNLTSLPQDFQENYKGEIGLFWENTFSLQPKGSNILDLCTGNGAIALLAGVYSANNNTAFKVTGVDAANINKENIVAKYSHLKVLLDNLQFIANSRIENINFPAASFDLITSQYGIEYCDWQESAQQVSKLLKPGGSLVFISHSSSTAILSFMEQEQLEYERLQNFGLFSTLSNFLKNKSSHKETQKKLNRIAKNLQKLHSTKPSDLYRNILAFLQKINSFDKATFKHFEKQIEFQYKQYKFAFARLQDIVWVSNKIKNKPDWYLIYEREGLQLVEQGTILQDGRHNAGNYYKFVQSK